MAKIAKELADKAKAQVTGELYLADGTTEIVRPADGKRFTAQEQWKFVGGGRETLDMGWQAQRYMHPHNRVGPAGFVSAALSGGLVRDGYIMVVNENGLNERLPINEKASALWGGAIVGNVLFCKRSATVRGCEGGDHGVSRSRSS
jgi:hypothetical protein